MLDELIERYGEDGLVTAVRTCSAVARRFGGSSRSTAYGFLTLTSA